MRLQEKNPKMIIGNWVQFVKYILLEILRSDEAVKKSFDDSG